MRLRTFLGIDLPFSVQSEIGQKQQSIKREINGLSWVNPDNLHITLKFLGATTESQIEEIQKTLERSLEGTSPFLIELGGLGVFPDKHAPQILWIGIEGLTNELLDLASQVEESVVPIGFQKDDKSFHPHLTIARIKKDHRKIGQGLDQTRILAAPCSFGRLRVEKVCLFKSELYPTGPVYTKIWFVTFGTRE